MSKSKVWVEAEKIFSEEQARRFDEKTRDWIWRVWEENIFGDFFRKKDLKYLKVLDIGCGHGISLWTFLKEDRYNYYYYGTDININNLINARFFHKDGYLCVSNGLRLPFKDETFDIVVSLGYLHHIPEIETKGIPEIFRVLKKNGYLLIREPISIGKRGGSPFERGIPFEDIKPIFERYGEILLVRFTHSKFIHLLHNLISILNLSSIKLFYQMLLFLDYIPLYLFKHAKMESTVWFSIIRKVKD